MIGGGDLFAQVIAVLGLVLGSGGILAVFTDKMKRKREAERIGAEANKLGIDGQVQISGATLEWARDFRKEAQDAKAEAAKAALEARAATAQADACSRDNANLHEEIKDLRTKQDELLRMIRDSCAQPPLCQVFKHARTSAGR